MNTEEAEKTVRFFTEIQVCQDKRAAFVKGVLYGLGFANSDLIEPNWGIIRKLIERGRDTHNWLELEQDVFRVHRKVFKEHVELWSSM